MSTGAYANVLPRQRFLSNTWKTLQSQVRLRYFQSKNFNHLVNESSAWNNLGEDLRCSIYKRKVGCEMPLEAWNSSKILKVFTHGFDETVAGEKIVFLKGVGCHHKNCT